jgi:hypothetical protein
VQAHKYDCPLNRRDLSGLLWCKTLKDIHLSGVLLRAFAQIRMIISIIFMGQHPDCDLALDKR